MSMVMKMRRLSSLVLVLGVAAAAATVVGGQAPDERSMFDKIRAEGIDRSQVDPVFQMLTTRIGPRLTASPAQVRASEFMRDRLQAYGLSNVHLEPWHFGRGWTLERLTVELVAPRYLPLIGYADGWSNSTAGELVAAPVFVGGKTAAEVTAMGDQLKGAIVLTQPLMTRFVRQDRPQPTDPSYVPHSADYATSVGRRGGARGPTPAQRLADALRASGAGVLVKPSAGEHGTVFVTGRDQGADAPPSITLSAEHYNMIVRMIQAGEAVRMRVNVQTRFYPGDGNALNVIAELPGSDPALKDQVVMIGGHLDSWHTGVGATDNADGATTVVEAMRILKAVGAAPRRTIRVALWSGEEQGLLGSRAWVQAHLAGEAHKGDRDRFDVYFNIDNGTGKIYGFYEQDLPAVAPLFDRWLAPLKAIGARKNVLESVGSTDHLSFDDVGVPGFNPIQDYVNYDIRTHHTNMDTPERLDTRDTSEAAVAMAWFAYEAAMADEMVPRPQPAGRGR
jgi:carboxypeptidase Q